MQPLPQNIEAETSILGAILCNNDSICDVIGIIGVDDFYKDAHKIIYKIMLNMYNQDIPIDVVTLKNKLGKEKLNAIGGLTYLSELVSSTITTCNIKDYAKIVKEKSDKRKIIKSCELAFKNAYSDDFEARNIINNLENKLLYVGVNNENKILTDTELMAKTLDMVQRNYANGGGITGISTGFKSLDFAVNGIVKGDFVVIAGRPSMGKTCFALNIINNIPQSKKVALFEMEMTAEKLGSRRLAAKSLINATNLPRGKLSTDEWERIGRKANSIALKDNVFTDTTAGQTIQEIKAKCKKIKLQHGLDVAIIDHLGLIVPTNQKENRVNQVSDITRNIKIMAKELNIAVIVLSQLSRLPEQRQNHRPILSDLRDSGTIEQDSDLVMFLYRDEYYNMDTDEKGILECIIAKQRDGRTGTIKFSYLPEYQLITEPTEYEVETR